MSHIRSRKHALSPYLAALAAASLSSAPLIAQADTNDAANADHHGKHHGDKRHGDKGTEVVVKGEKRNSYKSESASLKATANLLDTPQTVSVITNEIIREQGATTLTEALKNSPGVGTFYLGENGSTSTGDAIYMRGSDASGSIFVDGVRDIASVSRDVFNIEQVEVLKGAAGTDIGRGAATGAINLVTKRPTLTNAYSGSVGIGDGDYARATADLNWKLGKTTALRLNLLDQDAGVAGRDVIKNKRWGVASTLGLGLGTATRVYLGYQHIDQDNIPDGGVLTIGLPGYSSPDPTKRAYLTTAARVDPQNFYGTKDDRDKVTSDTLSAIVEHNFDNGMVLSNVTRWSQTDQVYQLSSFMAGTTQLLTPSATDPSTWTITRNINNKNVTNKTATNQTNLRTQFRTGSLEHTISTGIEFIREEQITRAYVGTGAYPAVSVYSPSANVSGYSRALSGAYTDGTTDTIGLYVNDTISFNEHWQLSAGLRNDHYKTDYDSVATTGVVTHYEAEDDLLSGKIGLVYKPAENSSVYASYAVTKQPPGGANFTLSSSTTVGANNPDVEPQSAKTSELGTKWNLMHNHLTLTGALYRTEYSDAVAQDTDGSYYRTGEKSVSGIELGAVGQITKAWNISAGYTVMDSKVKNQTLVAADGSSNLTYNPSDAGTLWTTYSLPNGLTFGGGLNYSGEMKRGTDGAVGTPTLIKSYLIYNGVVKYRLNKRVELQLNAYNLLDKTYVASINKSGYRYTPGIPRSFRLTANFNF